VLLIGRRLQIELHCATIRLPQLTSFVKQCYDDSTCTGAHLAKNFVDPERASLIDGKGVRSLYPRPACTTACKISPACYFGIKGSSSRSVGTPLPPIRILRRAFIDIEF